MNWAAVAAVASCIALIVLPITMIYTSGRRDQKIDDHGNRILNLEESRDDHAEKIGNHAVEIAKLNAWRDGYHAGVKSVPREEV